MIRTATNKNAKTQTKLKKTLPDWAVSPNSILGCFVEKRFKGQWHVGQIMTVNTDEDTLDTIWEVDFDDGDTEDYNAQELDKILCLDLQDIL